MILIDFNQVCISNLMETIKGESRPVIDLPMIRHMILNTIRSQKMKHSNAGEVVICCDSRHYWRKDIFPYYKFSRKKDREESKIDWNKVFECFNQVKSELIEVFPYRLIEVLGAEADDIIGVLTIKYGSYLNTGVPIVICSEDKDFRQLHHYGNVKQYAPIFKKDFIVELDPEGFLKEQIIRGDRGDGVPNILSPANCLAIGQRQKSVMSVKLKEWVKQDPIDFCDPHMLERYLTNEKLIDLTFTPEHIRLSILEEFDKQENKKSGNLFNYFFEHSLKQHMQNLQDFKQ